VIFTQKLTKSTAVMYAFGKLFCGTLQLSVIHAGVIFCHCPSIII